MDKITSATTKAQELIQQTQTEAKIAVGGLSLRTDLRAGLAWDDLDDKAQELWGKVTDSMSSLTGGDVS